MLKILDFRNLKLYNWDMNKNKTELKNYQKLTTLPLHIEVWHPDSPIPLHYHDCAELLLVSRGNALCQVNDNTRLKFSKGDLFVISGDLAHNIYDVKNFSAYRLLFDLSLLDGLCDEIKNSSGYNSMINMSGIPHIKYGHHAALLVNEFYFNRITAIFEEMICEYEHGEYMHETYMIQCLHVLITLIMKCYDDRVRHKKITPADLAVGMMQRHLHEKIVVADITKHFGITPRYFRTLFEERWGIPPAQFLTDLRLRKAKTLLLLTDMTITEIAMTCGFCDSSHFSNVFFKHEGFTPRDYRKLNKQ